MVFDAAALIDPGGNAARAVACTRPLSRPGELADLSQAAGLVDVVQDMLTIRMDFACFPDFWAPVEGREGPVVPYVRGLGAGVRMRLRLAVKQAYLAGEADGPRSYAATAWVVKGASRSGFASATVADGAIFTPTRALAMSPATQTIRFRPPRNTVKIR